MKRMTKSALLLTGAFLALQAGQASAQTMGNDYNNRDGDGWSDWTSWMENKTQPGWYGSLGAGANFEEQAKSRSGAGSRKFNFDPGFDAQGSIGYEWDSGLRLEGELFHGNAAVDKKDGAIENDALFANLLYDFNLKWPVTPYLGAGVGIDYAGADQIGPTAPGGHLHGSYPVLAYQGIAGFSVPVDRQWSVTADYRYIMTDDPKFADIGGHDRTDNASHNILVGVRYNFYTPERPQPPARTEAPRMQPRPMAKPAVAPIPQTFQVFFDFDKSTLTPEAKRIIASAAQEFQNGHYIRLVVTGHTDTKGPDRYNMRLSERRANAVKAELVRLGVDGNTIVARGVGKQDLLVPTNDQVREAQNRRAEIVLEKQQ